MSERSVTVRLRVADDFSNSLDSYNQKMGQAEQTTQAAGNNADTSTSKFGGIGRAVAGAFTIAAAAKVVDFGLKMNQLGVEVNATKTIFDQLIAPMGDAEEIMGRLRDATLGAASDNEIRTGANMLMRMNIAENPEELEEIITMITRLKSPTEDLGGAIENFSLMMANQSVLRLDSFGLSSGRVRERINELLESGQALNREEAFKMATLEEGARAIERLGTAATTAGTPLARLETNVQNLMEAAGSNINMGVTGTIGILEIALGLHPEQQRQAQERMTRVLDELSTVAVEGMAAKERGEVGDLSDNFISSYMNNLVTAATNDPTLLANMDALRDKAASMLTPAEYNMPTDTGVFRPLSTGVFDAYLNRLTEITVAQMEVNANSREAEAQARAEADAMAAAADAERERLRIAQERQAMATLQSGKSSLLGGLDSLEIEAIETAFRNIDTSANSIAGMEMPPFLTGEQAEQIGAMADEAERMAEEIQRMADANPDLFTSEEIENAQTTADSVRDMAEQAQKAADAFDKMKLSEVFGQTSGGTMGELSDMVIDAMVAAGALDEQIDAMKDALNVASGRETASSLFVRDTLIPMISAEADPETVAAMTSRLNDILRTAMLEGVDVNDEEFLGGLRDQLTPEALMGADFDPEAFIAPFVDVKDETTEAAVQTDAISTDIAAVGEAMPGIATETAATAKAMAEVGVQTDRFRAKLVETFSKTYGLNITVKHDAPPWLAALLDAGSFEKAMAQATRDAGGVPPGVDRRNQ